MIFILGIVKSTFLGKPSQDLADEEERESERADVPDVEVDSSGNIAMMIMMIILISDVHGDPTVNIAIFMRMTNC